MTSCWPEVRDEPRAGDPAGRRPAAAQVAGDGTRVRRTCPPGARSRRKLRRFSNVFSESGAGAASSQSGAAALDGRAIPATQDFGEDGPEEVAGAGRHATAGVYRVPLH